MCIPLCDGVHFQGYVVDVLKKEVIHIDSLRPANGKNPISDIIAKVLFEQKEVRFNSYFTTRVQFDSKSSGVWLIAAIAAYVHSLPKPSVINDGFDIVFNLFEQKKESRDKNVESEVPLSKIWKSEGHINMHTSAKFLIDVLKNNPTSSPFYTKVLPKGIRSNYFYITDTTKCPMSHITSDNNGAYVKMRSTNKLYYEVRENAHTVHMDDNHYFYNTRNSNKYTRSCVSINDVIMLKRTYCVSESLSLSRTIFSFASPADGPNIPYVAVFYQTH